MENGNRTAAITRWDFIPGSLPFPLIIAHRGDATSAPENTIPAFKKALNLGADGIELDCGHLMLLADTMTQRGCVSPPAFVHVGSRP